MLQIGSFRAQACAGVTRRAFLRAGTSLPLLGALAGRSEASVATDGPSTARAKSTVFVWLWGGPSHLDTVDPKPDAPHNYRGPFTTIPTREPGVRYTELLPHLAARSDRFSLIRTHVTPDSRHPEAASIGMTGYKEDAGPIQPAFGSIVARQRGGSGALPPYVMLSSGTPRVETQVAKGYGGGHWGKAYDPFVASCSESGETGIPSLRLLDDISPARLDDRYDLQAKLDQMRSSLAESDYGQWDVFQKMAFTLLSSRGATAALDLSREKPVTREAYGQSSFGQSLLLARRLVEAEVPYVHVNWSEYAEAIAPRTDFGWDTHIHNFDYLPRLCQIFDRAFSAFLDDLYDRGLIDDTLVVCIGEFGRTPKINSSAARDHWKDCYFSIWAGGGVQPGRVIGESTRLAEYPVTRAYEPSAVGATILQLMGIDGAARSKLDVLREARVIHELL